jgi:hypothetical protein
MNDTMRAIVAASLRPVRPLPSPSRRALSIVPLALLLLVTAPLAFNFRDLAALGWSWSWAASLTQTLIGVAVIAASLREAVPGRAWSTAALSLFTALIGLLFVVVTSGAWQASPVVLERGWWQIGVMCLAGSATSALPAVVLSAILIVRAFPLRPALAGAMGGLGAGLLADAGWRLFCHFSEPAHVLVAHFGGVALAALAGAALTPWLRRRT